MKTLLVFCLTVSIAAAQAPLDPFGDPAGPMETHEGLDGLWTRDDRAIIHVKYFFAGRFALSRIDRATNVIKDQLVGVCRYSPPTLQERARVTTELWEKFLRTPLRSEVGMEGISIFAQHGIAGKKEVWMRQDGSKTLQDVADFSTEITDMDGTWFTNTLPVRTVKVLYRGRGFCTKYDLKTQRVLNHHYFIYSFDGTILKENVLYATEGWKKMIGTTIPSRMTWIGRGAVDQTHTNGNIEQWTRAGEKPKKGKFEGVIQK